MRRALLNSTTELAQSENRDPQLTRQRFQRARDLSKLLDPALAAVASDQLKVVNDDQVDTVLSSQSSGFAAEFHDRNGGGIVDPNRGFGKMVYRRVELVAFLVRQMRGANTG